MAISQDRVIAIVEAGRNFRTEYNNIISRLNEMRYLDPKTELFSTKWTALLQDIIYPFPTIVQDSVTLDREHEHFRINARRNEKKAEALRNQRLADGIIPRPKAASTLEVYKTHPFKPQHSQITPQREPTPEEQALYDAELEAFNKRSVIDTKDPDFMDKILGRKPASSDTPRDGHTLPSLLVPEGEDK